MQIGARYQAVLEILTEVFQDKTPADKIINDYLRKKKYIGSKDRRFITDMVWHIIRNRLKLEFDSSSNDPRRILLYTNKDKLSEIFDDSKYGLSPLTDEEKSWLNYENDEPYPDYVEAECPQWLFTKIKNIDYCKALNQTATTDIRAHNITRNELQQKLSAEGIETSFGAYSPHCLKISNRLVLNNCMAWQDGLFEVQDEASQIASILVDAKENHKIIDYCCGAGGKSLAISNELHNQGEILAYDIDPKRLENIKPRIQRLKVKNISLTDIIADSDKNYDRFVLDAPCSGTGTWRRSPDAKFRLTKEKLYGLTKIQADLLNIASQKTAINGRIIYITCSVLKDENEDIIESFLKKHDNFAPINLKDLWAKKIDAPYPCASEKYLRMSPLITSTDGFFVCVLERIY
ncbi:MAG: RsmB/NOP family class I SAM-dependent RNA methyltransferase [Alphaproteobacteria bacterium]|nr:RsmB/NOP family class I SAM-dependent RNA methyltransferase [Alphaproteobacteria bacterium]